jgi:hypothetical protein
VKRVGRVIGLATDNAHAGVVHGGQQAFEPALVRHHVAVQEDQDLAGRQFRAGVLLLVIALPWRRHEPDRAGPHACVDLRRDRGLRNGRIDRVAVVEDEQLGPQVALAGGFSHLRAKLRQHALGAIQIGQLGVLPLDND